MEKTKKVNTGEVPQYYVEGSHEAIIAPDIWALVQAEFARRKTLGATYSGKSTLSAKLVGEECGAFYGRKVWHSTDAYKKEIRQCNGKIKDKAKHCGTPTLSTLVKQNASTALAQDEYARKYDSLSQRYEAIIDELNRLNSERTLREQKDKAMGLYIRTLKKSPQALTEWDDTIWTVLVEKAIVHRDKSITFVFYNGNEVRI